MKSTRRLLSIILCLIMCLSLLPVSAFADDGIIASGDANPTDPGKVSFKLYKSGKLVISGYGTVDAMEHWSFDSSGVYSFSDDAIKATQSETKTLVVEQGITELGDYVFTECAFLTSVTLPNSLVKIGEGAFDDCQRLEKITIPGNVTEIGDYAFNDCVNLKNVTLSTGLQTIGKYAFADCSKLESIVIPANVKTIGDYAFEGCGSLKTITFKGNFDDGSGNGVAIATDAFKGVTATVYYPVDNNSWNIVIDPMNTYNDFGGRLTWLPSAAASSADGWVKKNGDWYYYVDGQMLINSWKAYGGEWFYFGADGRMYQGRKQIDGDYYYFGVDGTDDKVGARLSGMHAGEFYGQDGKWQPSYLGVDDSGLEYNKNGWQQSSDGKWFFIRNKAKVTGWLYSKKYWYYLDPTTGAMVTGWLSWNGNTYYLRPLDKAVADGIPDKEGSMIAGRTSDIGGTYYTFDKNGALIGGKMEDNPMGLQTGWKNEGSASYPDWKFYGSDGKMAVGWINLDNNWFYFDKNGKMQTGWKKISGVWYYLTKWAYSGSGDEDKSENWVEITDPTDLTTYPGYQAGKMVKGFNKIPYTKNGVNTVKTYYFKSNGALNGKGWIKVGLKWYHLEVDGVVNTGWFRDKQKWYFLDPSTDPIGEMVTGYVEKQADGTNMTDPGGAVGGQSFKPSGEWIGAGNLVNAGKAGAWKEHDGEWYYYNTNGDDYPTNNNAVTGWQSIGGKWYYLDPSSSPAGKMLTGWQEIDGEKYFFEASGAALGGWQKIDGVWYYLYPKHDGGFGKMLKGWQYINNKWYHLDETSGALQDGWVKKAANDYDSTEYWFYLEENESSGTYGAMQEGGWKQIKGKWYFFHDKHDGYYGKLEQGEWIKTNGKWYYVKASTDPAESWMVTGVQTIDGKTYNFGSDGALIENKTGWQKSGDKWNYYNSDGTLATGEKTISGKDYYFDENGVMQTGLQDVGGKKYYYDSEGAKVKKTGLQTVDGKTLYFDSSNAVQTGWQTIDGKKYYFDDSTGAMKKGIQNIGGKNYYFDSDGVMQTGWQTVSGKKYNFGTDGAALTGWQTIDSDEYYFDANGVMQHDTTIDGKTLGPDGKVIP